MVDSTPSQLLRWFKYTSDDAKDVYVKLIFDEPGNGAVCMYVCMYMHVVFIKVQLLTTEAYTKYMLLNIIK